jgi:hypothetical protein
MKLEKDLVSILTMSSSWMSPNSIRLDQMVVCGAGGGQGRHMTSATQRRL